jgi:beta-N-acetylhexosaminidase
MKNKSTSIFIIVLAITAVLLGYNYFKKPIYNKLEQRAIAERAELTPEPVQDSESVEENNFFDQMTAKQKIIQLIAMPININDKNQLGKEAKEIEWIKNNQPGIVIFFGEEINNETAAQTITLIKDNTLNMIPLLFAVDHEGGIVQRFSGKGFSQLPSWSDACSKLTAPEKEELYQQSAMELSEVGINFVFAPMLDIAQNHPVLKNRICADADQIKESADIYIVAFGKQGIMPIVKHFPGIGSSKLDLHNSADQIELQKDELNLFKDILDKYPNIGVMTAHIKVKDEFGGAPCSLSTECLQRFEDVYPEALVFTDALEMASAQPSLNPDSTENSSQILANVSKQALLAGNDVLVYGKGVTIEELDEVISFLVAEYNDSARFKQRVDTALNKIINLKRIDGE